MKTIEEFIQEKHYNELQFPKHKQTDESFFIDWAKFGAREAQRFIPFDEELPPIGKTLLFYHEKWINEDFNPEGIRIGFRTDEDYITAHWWDYQDTFMTVSHSDCDNKPGYSQEIKDSIKPTHWRPLFRKL